MMRVVSVVLGLIPLAGVAWTILQGTSTTVDSPIMSLILLALSENFFLNAYWEMRHRVSSSKRAKALSVQKTS